MPSEGVLSRLSATEAPLSLLDDVPVQPCLFPVRELLPRSQPSANVTGKFSSPARINYPRPSESHS